jgi:hypothetical protein
MRKIALLAGCLLLTAAARRHVVAPPTPPPIDIRRSLVVTETDILSAFDFQRVVQTLTDRSGTPTTALQLYRQWFDTQNPKPGLAVANAPHCDDFIVDGKPAFNGFARTCPTPEGILATSDPFAAHDYTPTGITMRLDKAPADGSNCGQYRIVYAKTTLTFPAELHIIFEPVLPNPNPSAGIEGCRPVAQFWADLSGIDSISERRTRIEHFFFDGIPGFEPVLQPSHFTAESGGGIRTFQATTPSVFAQFFQFHLQQQPSGLLMVPGTLEDATSPLLFNGGLTTPLGDEFRQFFISQVATLAINDVNGFYDRIPDKYLMGETSNDSPQSGMIQGAASPGGQAFKGAITAELQRIGSNLTSNDVILRATMLNCLGCHGSGINIGGGIVFPPAQAATHITESLETVGGVARHVISPALRDVYAPNRARILTDFLAGKPLPVHSNGTTIGGGRTSD